MPLGKRGFAAMAARLGGAGPWLTEATHEATAAKTTSNWPAQLRVSEPKKLGRVMLMRVPNMLEARTHNFGTRAQVHRSIVQKFQVEAGRGASLTQSSVPIRWSRPRDDDDATAGHAPGLGHMVACK